MELKLGLLLSRGSSSPSRSSGALFISEPNLFQLLLLSCHVTNGGKMSFRVSLVEYCVIRSSEQPSHASVKPYFFHIRGIFLFCFFGWFWLFIFFFFSCIHIPITRFSVRISNRLLSRIMETFPLITPLRSQHGKRGLFSAFHVFSFLSWFCFLSPC